MAFIAPLLSIIVGVLGVVGLIFTALRWRRDDTTAVVDQQNTLFNEMKILNQELRETTETVGGERDSLKTQVASMQEQIDTLQRKLDEQPPNVSRIERKRDA